MGCCVAHKAEGLSLELVFKSDQRTTPLLSEDGFTDVALDSQRSNVPEDTQLPLPSFSYMSGNTGNTYFVEKIRQRNSLDCSMMKQSLDEREMGKSQLGGNRMRFGSVDSYQPGTFPYRRASFSEVLQNLRLESDGISEQNLRIVLANTKFM